MKRNKRRKSRVSPPDAPRGGHRGRSSRRILPWLGLGALGFATYWMSRRETSSPPSHPPSLPPDTPLGELPEDVDFSWIPGAFGTLRVAERHPEGRLTLVFVHGLAGRLEHWAPVFQALGPGLRTLALDLPGHGESDPARPADYGVPALASSIGAVVEGFGLRRVVLVGHSLGALTAIDYASRHPDRVAGLLLVDPSGDQSRTKPVDRKVLLDAMRKDPRGECEVNFRHFLSAARPEVERLVLEHLASTPEGVLLGALEGSATYAPLKALERYPGPVLSVVSELNDSPVSLHRLNDELRAWHVPGASHWLMLDRPDEVLEILWSFLEEV